MVALRVGHQPHQDRHQHRCLAHARDVGPLSELLSRFQHSLRHIDPQRALRVGLDSSSARSSAVLYKVPAAATGLLFVAEVFLGLPL